MSRADYTTVNITSTGLNDVLIDILPSQLNIECAPWHVPRLEGYKPTKHSYAVSVSLDKGDCSDLEGIPDNFFSKELKIIAYGSDEEAVSIMKQYGVLAPPYSRSAIRYLSDVNIDANRLVELVGGVITADEMEKILAHDPSASEFNKLAQACIEQMRRVDYLGDEYIGAIIDSLHENEEAYRYHESTPRPDFVYYSMQEIRMTAERLLRVVEMLYEIETTRTLKNDSDTSFRVSPEVRIGFLLGFLRDCLADVTPWLSLQFSTKSGEPPMFLGNERFRRYAGHGRYGDLTEAVAAQIFNTAISNTPWRVCAFCGERFKVKRDKGRYTSRVDDLVLYDTAECQKAAKAKRYRDRKKEAIRLYKEGHTPEQIAKIYDSKVSTIEGWIASIITASKAGESNAT